MKALSLILCGQTQKPMSKASALVKEALVICSVKTLSQSFCTPTPVLAFIAPTNFVKRGIKFCLEAS